MYVRPMHHSEHLTWWLVIAVLAVVVCLLFATAVGAADLSSRKPALLPTEIHHWAQPMGVPPESAAIQAPALTDSLWQVLELHHARHYEEAIAAWNRLTLPAGMEVWRQLGLGQARLASDQFEEAERALGETVELRGNYAIGHYFLGVLRLQQSYLAEDSHESTPDGRTRLVALAPRFPARSKGLYLRLATESFEAALAFRDTVQTDELLVPTAFGGTTTLEPTVDDLMKALGADLWEGKAHNALSYLYLEEGQLEVAEGHMDRAVAEGLVAVYGYRDLGDEYQARGQHADAARAYLKGARYTADKVRTTLDALHSLRDALISP